MFRFILSWLKSYVFNKMKSGYHLMTPTFLKFLFFPLTLSPLTAVVCLLIQLLNVSDLRIMSYSVRSFEFRVPLQKPFVIFRPFSLQFGPYVNASGCFGCNFILSCSPLLDQLSAVRCNSRTPFESVKCLVVAVCVNLR